ncbi:hypothetical protein HanPI659440_Chr07g0256241 [Helianthus annuus]|nr:hypothetical protein HanPI659440_Chr07g0256241 [Helianthus annuus]
MEFRGIDEIPLETMDASVDEVWYQDIKEIPSIQLPERALVAVKMSLLWRVDRLDKPVYMEGKNRVVLYVVAYKRENGKMTAVPLEAGEKSWYQQIVGNFALPKDEDLQAQPAPGAGELINLGVGPNSKKKRCVAPATTVPKNADMPKADVPKAEKKKGLRKPKAEPQDTANIPASNPDDPIDLDSSPELLKRVEADKRKRLEGGAAAQPVTKMARKKIGKKGNLDAFAAKFSPEKTSASVQADT